MKIIIDENQLFKILSSWLNGEYYCTRVWEAWSYGTMTEEDFVPIDVDEIVQSIKEASDKI
jgi:hypothetical protein